MVEEESKVQFHAQLGEVRADVVDALREGSLPAIVESIDEAPPIGAEVMAPYQEQLTALMNLVETVATGIEGKDYVILSGNSGRDSEAGTISTRTVFELAGAKKDGVVRQLVVSERRLDQSVDPGTRIDARLEARWADTINTYGRLKAAKTGESVAQREDIIERLVTIARTPVEQFEFTLRETTYDPLPGGRYNIGRTESLIGVRTESYFHGRHQAFPVLFPLRDARNAVPQYAMPIIRRQGEKLDIEAAPYHAVPPSVFKTSNIATINKALGMKNSGYRS